VGTTSYVYQGNQATVTDPAGKWKTSTTDAFSHCAVASVSEIGTAYRPTHAYLRHSLRQWLG
jgi:hypothetical protein